MATTMIRVEEETSVALKQIADERGVSVGRVVSDLLEEERRRRFWAQSNEAFLALRSDPDAWSAEQEFRKELEGTLADGLEDEY
jgi:predicted DNA-binding ribbon-helix-helix protein